jgi:formyl-CoA transferase
MGSSSAGPLSDLRVLEMGQVLAGPYCGRLYGDFGAEVIKIEQPKADGLSRQWGRQRPSSCMPVGGRNEKSVTLDVHGTEGQAIVRDLVRRVDILIENFRPGTMEKWGLGYDQLAEINPRLIMIRISALSQSDPGAAQIGSTGPACAGGSIGESLAAIFAALGGLIALQTAKRTGVGQVVDSAIHQAALAMMESSLTEYGQLARLPERTGAALPDVAPANVYPCKDGMVLIAANPDPIFRRLVEAMGHPSLADDARYATSSARGAHQTELDSLVADWTRTMTVDATIWLTNKFGVPAGRIDRVADTLDDPHFAVRGSTVRVNDKPFGAFALQGVSLKRSTTPGSIRSPKLGLGAHNEEIYGGLLGFSAERIASLKDRGVI